MTKGRYLSAFRKEFKIDKKADLGSVAVAVESIYTAAQVAVEFLEDIDPNDNKSGFRIHVLLNLIGRVIEHAKAMLVALATGSPASAEALSRIVVEGSVNVMYLATVGNPGTLIHFFRSWLNEHDKKLEEWMQINQLAGTAEVLAMIVERRQLIDHLKNFVLENEIQCEIDMSTSVKWPKSLFKRFEALHREKDYYTSYHRLSGASHLTGEDTLTWLLSINMTDEMRHKMGIEAWGYSIMMTRISCTFFVDAVIACVQSYGRTGNHDLRGCNAALERAVHEIAREAGVPMQKK